MSSSYQGSITTSGKSEAIRIEKTLFRQHPEFQQQAKVRVYVIAPGQMLLSLSEPSSDVEAKDVDPVVSAFLGFLEQDMVNHPERLSFIAEDEIQQVKALVSGVEVSDSDVIPEDVSF